MICMMSSAFFYTQLICHKNVNSLNRVWFRDSVRVFHNAVNSWLYRRPTRRTSESSLPHIMTDAPVNLTKWGPDFIAGRVSSCVDTWAKVFLKDIRSYKLKFNQTSIQLRPLPDQKRWAPVHCPCKGTTGSAPAPRLDRDPSRWAPCAVPKHSPEKELRNTIQVQTPAEDSPSSIEEPQHAAPQGVPQEGLHTAKEELQQAPSVVAMVDSVQPPTKAERLVTLTKSLFTPVLTQLRTTLIEPPVKELVTVWRDCTAEEPRVRKVEWQEGPPIPAEAKRTNRFPPPHPPPTW